MRMKSLRIPKTKDYIHAHTLCPPERNDNLLHPKLFFGDPLFLFPPKLYEP